MSEGGGPGGRSSCVQGSGRGSSMWRVWWGVAVGDYFSFVGGGSLGRSRAREILACMEGGMGEAEMDLLLCGVGKSKSI